MKTNEALILLEDKVFLDKIYYFSYHRCDTFFEAEDLCSDIIFAVVAAIYKQEHIEDFYAFVWTIAHRVYADHCRKRNAQSQMLSLEEIDLILASKENEIDKWIEEVEQQREISRIFKEIAFLSKMYREVMVMFYVDELKVKDIAERLCIKETTVKQRLFSARNLVRKEVKSMDKSYVLKPIKLAVWGSGNACGNDPVSKIERIFSQNLIYLCKDKPRSVKELSEELCVPMPYIEEELEIQCCGENGKYGMLRKLDNGKYVSNIHLVDYTEYDQANKIYEKYLSEFCKIIKNTLMQNEEKILSFPYLSKPKGTHFIMWSLISRIIWDFESKINRVLSEKYFSDIAVLQREYACVAIAYTDEQEPEFDFYGNDTICADLVGGYQSVSISNMYGRRMDKHFGCGHNLYSDQKLLMLLRAIGGGIAIDELSELEKEIAAKAIECGYLCKCGNKIEPKIIVIDKEKEQDFYDLSFELTKNMDMLIEQIAAELSAFMKKHIPKHLMNEYPLYTQLIAGIRILERAIEKCIGEGLLTEPKSRVGAEGVVLVVERGF